MQRAVSTSPPAIPRENSGHLDEDDIELSDHEFEHDFEHDDLRGGGRSEEMQSIVPAAPPPAKARVSAAKTQGNARPGIVRSPAVAVTRPPTPPPGPNPRRHDLSKWAGVVFSLLSFLFIAIVVLLIALVFKEPNNGTSTSSGGRLTGSGGSQSGSGAVDSADVGSPSSSGNGSGEASAAMLSVFNRMLLSSSCAFDEEFGRQTTVNMSSLANGAVVDATKLRLKNTTEELLFFGTRVAGSFSHGWNMTHALLSGLVQRCQDNASRALWKVTTDSFEDDVVRNSRVVARKHFSNVVAEFQVGNISNGHLILSAHFDSKWYTGDIVFLGACDSAVPVVMLLELMKRLSTLAVLKPDEAALLPQVTVMFFDGEEAFYTWSGTDNTYGSRHLAAKWEAEGRIKDISLFVLLDLIGPYMPKFHNYYPAQTGAIYDAMRGIVFNVSKQLFPDVPDDHQPAKVSFPVEPTGYVTEIEDDHIPWHRRNVPILHMIPSPFPLTWHRPTDDATSINYDVVSTLVESVWQFVLQYNNGTAHHYL